MEIFLPLDLSVFERMTQVAITPWTLSGTEVSGCKGKDILPFLASSDSQGPHDQIIEELNSHFSR
jgi:hypothetical protein